MSNAFWFYVGLVVGVFAAFTLYALGTISSGARGRREGEG
jgi:hypothetical protein